MYEVIYLDKKFNKREKSIFWNKKEAEKFVKFINKEKDFVLLAIHNNSYLYD